MGTAALAIWFDLDPAGQEDFDAWYPRQHMPERLSVPGFLRGRRYAAGSAGAPAFFTLYELAGPDVAGSAPYLERLNNPTDWTRRVLPRFRGMVRNAYRLLGGGAADTVQPRLLTARIAPHSGRGPAVRAWLGTEGTAALHTLEGVANAAFYETEASSTSVITEERKLVGEVSAATPFLAVCELSPDADAGAVRDWWTARGTKLAADVEVDAYRLLYGLTWLGTPPG